MMHRMRICKLTIIIYILPAYLLFCQPVLRNSDSSYFSPTSITHFIIDDASHVLHVGLGLLKSPITASYSNWLGVGYAVSATSVLFIVDAPLKEFFLSNQTSFNDNLFFLDDYLNGRYGTYYAAGLYGTGFIIRNEKLRRTGLYALEAIFYAQSITRILKFSFGRRRPEGDDPLFFKPFQGTAAFYRSLPSGHTTGAFAFATVMARSVNNLYWKIFWYGSASLVGMSRSYHNAHWFSDTFLAGCIGYSMASYIVTFSQQQKRENLRFYPAFAPQEIGFVIYF
jgi:membrane-associated phospholipid phosphatase